MTIYDNTVPAIDCVEFVRLVDDLVDADPQQWGAIVARHLQDCPPCLVYLQQMLDLKALLSQVSGGQTLSGGHAAALLERLDELRRSQG